MTQFLVSLSVPSVSDPDPDWIRIQSGQRHKNREELRKFMYLQPKMLDPDSMNPDPKHYQVLPILESFSNSVCLLRMTGSSSPRSSVMFTMTVFSLLACAPMSRPYSDMESSLPQHRISILNPARTQIWSPACHNIELVF
jgi:hypothetical protein